MFNFQKLEWPELNCGSNKEKIKDLGSEVIMFNIYLALVS